MDSKEFIEQHKNDFFLTGKKSYEIKIGVADKEAKIHNDLEDANYDVKPGDVVLKGTVGEMWCAKMNKVLATYKLPNGQELSEDFLRKNAGKFIRVKTSWADLAVNRPGVDHGKGDFLVCGKDENGKPNLNGSSSQPLRLYLSFNL